MLLRSGACADNPGQALSGDYRLSAIGASALASGSAYCSRAAWLQALVFGTLYALMSTPLNTLGHGDSLAAVLWPAPACAVAWLWQRPREQWPISLLAIFVAMLVVGHFDDFPLSVDALFALDNAAGVGLGTWLAWRFVSRRARLDTTARFTRFVIVLPLFCGFLMALAGSILAHAARGLDMFDVWRTIMGSDSVAMLVLIPGILVWSRRPDPVAPPARWWTILVPAVVGVVVMVGAFRFELPNEGEHVLLILLLVWAAVAGGLRAATLVALVIAVTGVTLTITGQGSYHQNGLAGVRQLQADLAVLCLLVFYIAIALGERRVFEARLQRAHRLESLGLLVSGVAHDFNNVLGAVRGHAEYAEELLPSGAEARRSLQHVLAAVQSGHAMTQQMLLAVGRGGTRRSEAVPVRRLLEEAVALTTTDPNGPVRVDLQLVDTAASSPPDSWTVAGDHGQLVRVFLNLLRNAVLAARKTVMIQARVGAAPDDEPAVGRFPSGDVLIVDVHDDGSGIPADVAPRIFDPFFSTRQGKGGSGLGLSIAAGVVTDHGGGILCASGPAGGALFRVVLPLGPLAADAGHGAPYVPTDGAASDAASRDSSPRPSTMDGPVGEGESVLLVEADAALRVILEEWLAGMGFEPSSHESPGSALVAFQQDPHGFEFLVSDIEMDQLRGDELIKAARARHPELPALLISGAQQGSTIAAAIDVPFLAKPFGREAFERAVTDLHNNRKEPRR
jgi:signal transduction histidine kinase/ActR/RegA family two-component response regulator